MTLARVIIVLAILGVAAYGYFLYKKSKKKVEAPVVVEEEEVKETPAADKNVVKDNKAPQKEDPVKPEKDNKGKNNKK